MKVKVLASGVSGQMELYETLSVVFLVAGIVFFVVSILLFFLFKISGILAVKTGRAQLRTIKEMESANSETGRLRARVRNTNPTPGNKMWNTAQLDANSQELSGESMDESATTLLEVEATTLLDSGSNETSLLQQGANETMLLSADSEPQREMEWGSTASLAEPESSMGHTGALGDGNKRVSYGKFVIKREIVMIHTEEKL